MTRLQQAPAYFDSGETPILHMVFVSTMAVLQIHSFAQEINTDGRLLASTSSQP